MCIRDRDTDADGVIHASELADAFAAIDGDASAHQEWQDEFQRNVSEILHRNKNPLRAGLRAFDPNGLGLIDPDDLVFALECLDQVAGEKSGGTRLDKLAIRAMVDGLERVDEGQVDYAAWLRGYQVCFASRSD
eukprot:TRINITY_DN60891_c0_g1_i2.p2 TRINITY_DN60891_c0_g1~~TRINITY_DN60891_c0_g1_i2.p2  ORF type:complete len:134 (-),score=42.91 TRINITY_DN60891_c0_g1_i2:78-479(-)